MTRAGIMSSTPLGIRATSPGTMCSPTGQAMGLWSTSTCSGTELGKGDTANNMNSSISFYTLCPRMRKMAEKEKAELLSALEKARNRSKSHSPQQATSNHVMI